MTMEELVRAIASSVAAEGGRAYYVGGYVRDRLLGRENKDIDIEIHGIEAPALERILNTLGECTTMGSSFGVYGLKHWDLDIAMPRSETALGRGHKDFRVDVDPYLGCENAASRRDFTINALMEDILTGEILDFFGGKDDLKQGVIRHVSDTHFGEDPLRVLRCAQFSARFGFIVDESTLSLCSTMDLTFLPRERVMGELEKALLKADRPSVFFEVLRDMRQLDFWFPEVQALAGVPQSVRFHPEGDVWTHTMLVLDMAASLREGATQPLSFMLSALCHDFGKIVTTEYFKGDYHAYEHEQKGLPLVERFLSRLSGEKALNKTVQNLCLCHMRPNRMAQQGSSRKSWNHLYDECVCPHDLLLLSRADYLGCGGTTEEEYAIMENKAKCALESYYEVMSRPFVAGKDLQEAGIKPGKHYGELLAFAHKLRLAGVSKEDALRQVLAMARKL